MRPADRAWITLVASIVAYDLLSKTDELMSQAADRYTAAHPWLTRTLIAVVAIHLARALPDRFDVMRSGWMLSNWRVMYRQSKTRRIDVLPELGTLSVLLNMRKEQHAR